MSDSRKSESFTSWDRKVAACRRASSVGSSEIFCSWIVSGVSNVVIGFSSLLVGNALEAFRLASYRAPRAFLLPATTQTKAQTITPINPCYDVIWWCEWPQGKRQEKWTLIPDLHSGICSDAFAVLPISPRRTWLSGQVSPPRPSACSSAVSAVGLTGTPCRSWQKP